MTQIFLSICQDYLVTSKGSHQLEYVCTSGGIRTVPGTRGKFTEGFFHPYLWKFSGCQRTTNDAGMFISYDVWMVAHHSGCSVHTPCVDWLITQGVEFILYVWVVAHHTKDLQLCLLIRLGSTSSYGYS